MMACNFQGSGKPHMFLKNCNMKIKASLLLVLSCLSVVVFATQSSANAPKVFESNDNPSTGLTISPPTYELTANPGDILENYVKLIGKSDNTVTYEATVEDFRVEGQEGSVQLTGDDANPNAFSKWFTVEPKTITLSPRETKTVKFTIKVPENGEPGGHFASVLFQPKSIETQSGTGAQVLQKIGALVLLNVSGAFTESGKVQKFESKNFIGTYETIIDDEAKTTTYSPRNEEFHKESKKTYFNEGPVAFDLVVKNEGNVHFRPKGTVTIYNIFGKKVDELQIEPRNVFPNGGERRITILWPKKNLWGGRYTAKVVALYGSKNQTLTAETSFWAFPSTAAIVIVVVLAVVILLRKRIIKAIKVIAKG